MKRARPDVTTALSDGDTKYSSSESTIQCSSNVRLTQPSSKYINRFFRRAHLQRKREKDAEKEDKSKIRDLFGGSRPWLWVADMFSRNFNFSKEITESMAAVYGVVNLATSNAGKQQTVGVNSSFSLKNRNKCVVYVVGDGKRPYTAAALVMMLDMKNVYSIDPRMAIPNSTYKSGVLEKGVTKPSLHRCCIEGFSLPNLPNIDFSIVVSVHGHGPISSFYDTIPGKKAWISIPCCSDYGVHPTLSPLMDYVDPNVWSPKNRVFIYTNLA
jgi:hypothetical protein